MFLGLSVFKSNP